MRSSSLESVAVTTVSYNSSSHLGPFLESVREGESADVLIVVADNGSRDEDVSRALTDRFNAEFLELGENRGYGGAINSAVRSLPERIRYILVANPDVQIMSGAITELRAAFDRVSGVGAVGPQVLNEDGSIYPSARKLPSLRTGVGHAVFGRVWPSNPWTRSYKEDNAGGRERAVGWLSGSFVMVSREAFDDLGGFDEEFFMYFEDVDLGYRLNKRGWKSIYVPTARIIHAGAHSTATESVRMSQAHHASAYRYLSKKYSAPYLAPLRLILRAGLAIRFRLLTGGKRNGS